MTRMILRLLGDTLLVGILLFAGAGTLDWPRAWTLLIVMLTIRALGALAVHRVSPSLLRERAKLPIHHDQPRTDRVLLLAVLATGFLGLPALAALDVFHWRILPRPPHLVGITGLVLFAFGWILKNLALYANAFAVSVTRLQHDRRHALVDTGVYAIVRHPFYAADPMILIGLGLWLQSWTAAICAVMPISLMMVRLQLEERFLSRELPGYDQYMTRVPHRLLPGVW